jgi:hypothetical protein
MADYPNNYFNPREKENRSGVEYDPSKKTVIFVEDLNAIRDELIAIEQALGLANAKNYQKYVDRGDPSANDFLLANFTTDEVWHDLDLSSIVPNGAKAVHFRSVLKGNTAGARLVLRKKGNANSYNVSTACIQVANVEYYGDLIVSCDSNRKIQYWAQNITWSAITLTVRGWFI